MTTLHFGQQRGRQFNQQRRRYGGQFSLLLMAFAVIALGAFGYVGYVLWPRWPAPRLDAPAVPITVAGVAFNLPPAAIRRAAQRRSGAQERVDLVFLWPSLEPPDPAAKPSAAPPGTVAQTSQAVARVFMTILSAGDTLAADDRALTIYPRYAAAEPVLDASGLTVLAFRDGTPYQGEDRAFSYAALANALVPLPAPASTSGGSAQRTLWCASRATGSAIGTWWPTRSTD
jgi:hypothetical protein